MTAPETDFQRYTSEPERQIVTAIIERALAAGFVVSVYDGLEWTLKRSTDRTAILGALATTDTDTLRFRTADGETAGSVCLIWGNGVDVVYDCSASGPISAICESVDDDYWRTPEGLPCSP